MLINPLPASTFPSFDALPPKFLSPERRDPKFLSPSEREDEG